MTGIVIVNPFAGCRVGWTWAQHVAAINPTTGQHYAGGTDYIMYPPRQITAAADGVVELVAGGNGFTPGKAIVLKLADGRSINYREVASTLVSSGAKVVRGQAIGNPNRASRWPHIDATVNGVRVPFEPLVNSLTTASGGSVPLDNTPTPVHMEDIMHLIADPTLPEQPAPVGPYVPADRHTGGKYRLVNDASGRSAQVFGTQDQIDLLSGYLAWSPTSGAYLVGKTTYATPAQNTTWLLGVLASVGSGSGIGGAVDLEPVLDAIKAVDGDLLTAVGQVSERVSAIKVPTKGTVQLS